MICASNIEIIICVLLILMVIGILIGNIYSGVTQWSTPEYVPYRGYDFNHPGLHPSVDFRLKPYDFDLSEVFLED